MPFSVYALAQTLCPVHSCLILKPSGSYEFGQVAKLLICHLLFQSCQKNIGFLLTMNLQHVLCGSYLLLCVGLTLG